MAKFGGPAHRALLQVAGGADFFCNFALAAVAAPDLQNVLVRSWVTAFENSTRRRSAGFRAAGGWGDLDGGQMAARLRPAADVVAPRGCSKVAVESLLVFGHACFATTKHPKQGGPPWTNTSESTFTQQAARSRWWMRVASKRVRTSQELPMTAFKRSQAKYVKGAYKLDPSTQFEMSSVRVVWFRRAGVIFYC